MAQVSTYLNFPGNTEEVFNFYKTVFGTEFMGDGIMYFKDIPQSEGMPPTPEDAKNMVMHVALPITGGHILMGSDAPESMGFKVIPGNNVYINLGTDNKTETDRLFKALSEGGKVEMEPQKMFWGDYYCSLTDKYGIRWMIYNPLQK